LAKKVNRQIFKLALPNIFTNLTVPLLGMTDMFLMGHQESVHFVGAVALGSVIFNFVFWGFAFLRMSMSGVAAQTFGRNDRFEMAMVLERGLLIAIGGGLLLLLLQIPLANFSFWLLQGSAEVKEIARQYYFVRIWAAPASISLMVFYGWFLGMQNAIYPMIIAVTVNVVNVIISFILVFTFNMKAEGVALGSVIGEYVGLGLALFLFFKKYRWVASNFTRQLAPLLSHLKHFLNVSGDILIRTLCVIAVFTFFTSRSAGIGDVTLAINSTLLQYLFLFSYFLDGFAYAGEALVGKFYGARDFTQLKITVRKLMIWGAGFAILFSGGYALLGNYLLQFFTKQEAVLSEGAVYLVWVALIPLASFVTFIWDGIFIGLTASRAMRNTVLLSAVLFYFLPFYLLFPIIGNHAIWLSMILFMASRSVSLTIIYPRVLKRLQ
jgi:MATE family multidrug resistance protein